MLVALMTGLPTLGHGQSATSPGISDKRILFGQTAAFSGPAQDLGQASRQGILAAFARANRTGGIAGRELELLSLDDSYNPDQAIANAYALIQEHQAFAMIGAVGTPTSKVVQPLLAEVEMPYVAPLTGADFLRSPRLEGVINLRASYRQETRSMIDYLSRQEQVRRVAILYQNDSYGRAGRSGVLEALRDYDDLELAGEGIYQRNTAAVKTALLDIAAAQPDAVVMIAAHEPAATFVRWAKRIDFKPQFFAISFAGAFSLANALNSTGHGLLITQVVPFPNDSALPIVAEYLQDLRLLDARAAVSFVSLEGYLAGRLAVEGLTSCAARLTRDCFVEHFQFLEMDLGGIQLRYGEGDNQGMDMVFIARINASGEVEPVESAHMSDER